jgi:hypothetical protein
MFNENVSNHTSNKSRCEYGMPRDSVLRSLLLTLHVEPTSRIIEQFGERRVQFDDTQLWIATDQTRPMQRRPLIRVLKHSFTAWR